MAYSLKIGSLWGIPIEIHITFILLMVAIFILSYPQLYSFFLILFLFAFVVVHELSHSIVARHYKIKVQKIILYPIGGVSEIREIPKKPSIEWRMAIAGPFTSIVIGIVLFVLDGLVSIEMPVAPSLMTTGSFLLDLATINIFLGLFNLIPAFPMDGGRVFRTFLAQRMKFVDATKNAALIGKALGIVMAVIGIVYNPWLIVIGVFIYIGATEETESTIISTVISKFRVRDVMKREFSSVKPETTLKKALEVMFKAKYHDILVEKNGILNGIVTWDSIEKVKPNQRGRIKVGSFPMKNLSVFPDESVLDAYKMMIQERVRMVPVVKKGTNKVLGVVTVEDIAYTYQKAKSLR